MGQFVKGKYDSTPTENQLLRTQRDWEEIAGEGVDIEHIKGTIYGYCSELGALRLEHRYKAPNARAGYSQSLKTWYFSLQMKV
jgi:hypothetical protein